jgi:segregation and condensation protein A
MSVSDEYRVRLDVFEGPLDLLLYLIRKEEIDIHDIPIERVAGQYLEYIELMQMLDLNIAGEFLVMAATLMMIKSRMLLPVEERAVVEGEEEDEMDPRWDLVRRLVEYKKFKDAAQFLQVRARGREDVFGREAEGANFGPKADIPLQDVGLFDLLSAFNRALSRVKSEDLREIFSERYTVSEKIDDLLNRIRETARISISRLFEGMRSRHEIVVTFLAVLELIRLKHLVVRQPAPFGEIVIERLVEA